MIEAGGQTPLDYLLGVMRDPKAEQVLRFEAAKAAAPYVHPKLASIAHSGPGDGPIEVADRTDHDRVKAIALILAQARAKRAATG